MNLLVIEIADLGIMVEYDGPVTDILLDSFRPFISYSCHRLICRVRIESEPYDSTCLMSDKFSVVERTSNLFGLISLIEVDGRWVFRLSGGTCMVCTKDFAFASIYLSDSKVGKVEDSGRFDSKAKVDVSSLLYIVWCQSVVQCGVGFFCHASCIEVMDKGYLFLGPSGYGKSTQSGLWCKVLGGRLLNDDCPLLIPTESGAIVAGTPWSGKTPCYRKVTYQASAIMRLVRADYNRLEEIKYTDAFVALLPSCSCMRGDMALQERLYALVSKVVSTTNIYKFYCTPTEDAPKVAFPTCFGYMRESKSGLPVSLLG